MFVSLFVFRFLEPYIVDIESNDKHCISLAYHIVVLGTSLAKIHTDGNTIVPAEYRQCHTESKAIRIHGMPVQLIIVPVIVCTYPIGAPPHIIADIISVRYNLESGLEGL